MVYNDCFCTVVLSNKVSSYDPCSAVALHVPVINGIKCIFVVDDVDTCCNSFFYFFHQVVQVILAQLLKEVCVLRFQILSFY